MGIRKKVEWKAPWWSKSNRQAYVWCINHGIKIYAVPCSPGFDNKNCWIEVQANGRKQRSPKTYGPDELWDKVLELYKFYYDKNVQQ